MKKANILLNTVKKTVSIQVKGRMTKEDSALFIEEYNKKINSINPAEYTLEVDCVEMPVVTPEMAEELTGVMGLYKSTGFNKVIFQIKDSSVLKMQLSRIARNAGLTNAAVVDLA